MQTQMQETSLLAFWGEIYPSLSPRHKEVMQIFRYNIKDFTNRELLEELRLSDPSREINSVTPRVYELRGRGKNNPFTLWPILIKSRTRDCEITGRKAIAWQLNNR